MTVLRSSNLTSKYETSSDITQYILVQKARKIYLCQPKILCPAQGSPGSYIFRCGFTKPNHRPSESLALYGLRSTNRHLYQETLDFITFRKLCLRVVDWFTSPTVAFSETQKLTSDGFAQDNIVTVQLHFTLSVRSLNNLNSPRVPPAPGLTSNSLLFAIKKALKYRVSRASRHPKTPMQLYPFSLQPLVPLLDACPRLTFVSIATDDEAFYDLWQDPAGGLEAFLPILRSSDTTISYSVNKFGSCVCQV